MAKFLVVAAVLTTCLVGAGSTVAANAGTLETVRERGVLRCGVAENVPGFSTETGGQWQGFSVDYCRAIAAAVLGDAGAIEFQALDDRDRFTALAEGDIDVLSRGTVWTLSRDVSLGLTVAAANFHDGQGIMVPADLGLASVMELSGSRVCVQAGTFAEIELQRFFEARNMALEAIPTESLAEAADAYDAGRCAALSANLTDLHRARMTLTDPDLHAVLPEALAVWPLSLFVARGDDTWRDIVRWVHFALLAAEELGVTAENIDKRLETGGQRERGLLGTDGGFGDHLGLELDWAAGAIRAVGNYGEVFERNLGGESEFGMSRGFNALWRDGGLHLSPPFR